MIWLITKCWRDERQPARFMRQLLFQLSRAVIASTCCPTASVLPPPLRSAIARQGPTAYRSSWVKSMSSSPALVFEAHGPPDTALELRKLHVPEPKEGEVTVRFMLSPINPSDINTVEGKYPLKPTLPGVGGHEGVGEVTALGDNVQNLKVGDWVIPLEPRLGTWRHHGTYKATSFTPIPKDLPVETAAMLTVNPPTALAMLEIYVDLQPGDVVIQNGANSAVGKMVIQLAKIKGLKTINIIRERPNWDETVQELKSLGADVVTTENKARADIEAAGLAPAALAFNCVGGSSATTVAKFLRDGGTVVTYGAMSMQPVSIPTGLLIFKDLQFKGFWLSGRYARERAPAARKADFERLVQYIKEGKLDLGPTQTFPLSDFKSALQYYSSEHRPAKVLLAPDGGSSE